LALAQTEYGHVASLNLQMDEAQSAKLKGRHYFGLERLLALFWSLAEEHTGLASGGSGNVPGGSASQDELQSAEVLGHVASLVSMRLLSQARL
jgi:Origin recognition complex (ORC) subunit 5 C-terminus